MHYETSYSENSTIITKVRCLNCNNKLENVIGETDDKKKEAEETDKRNASSEAEGSIRRENESKGDGD